MTQTLQNIVPERQELSTTDFERISSFITSNYGIKLPAFKKTMVEGRLQKRLRATGVSEFSKYVEWVFSEQGKNELIEMVDAISTNKTDFFRESSHFDFLLNTLLPQFSNEHLRGHLKIWSSAASSGEEIYTLALVLEEFIKNMEGPKINYSILGTDISTLKLKHAITAVYPIERIKDVPTDLRNKYFLRSKDRAANTVRVMASIRNKTRFQRLNLIDESYNVNNDFDIIFCRNVLIYFDKNQQEQVINKLCKHLKPGGYFFLGHSESIVGKNVPLKQVMPTIYKKN